MAVKLWTVHFMRICVANLLLFISLYILFPVLSVEMADRLGCPDRGPDAGDAEPALIRNPIFTQKRSENLI